MKKIETRIIDALHNQTEFRSGNTEVMNVTSIDGKDIEGKVLLHGNLIATFNRALNQLEIEDGGWESVTTKSRLNALLEEFAPFYRVIQRDWKWYINGHGQFGDWLTEWEGSAVFRAGILRNA